MNGSWINLNIEIEDDTQIQVQLKFCFSGRDFIRNSYNRRNSILRSAKNRTELSSNQGSLGPRIPYFLLFWYDPVRVIRFWYWSTSNQIEWLQRSLVIDVGDGCWRRYVLVTILKKSPTLRFYHQHLKTVAINVVNNITVAYLTEKTLYFRIFWIYNMVNVMIL